MTLRWLTGCGDCTGAELVLIGATWGSATLGPTRGGWGIAGAGAGAAVAGTDAGADKGAGVGAT